MKGIVFTEFLELADRTWSPSVTEQVIEDAALPSGGAWTAVGTYDHHELVDLVHAAERRSGTPVPELLRAYGRWLFPRLMARHGGMLRDVHGVAAVLPLIDRHIHVEVRKLYPDAELPSVVTGVLEDGSITVEYRSPRPFADLAHGLIEGCADFYGETVEIDRTRPGGAGADDPGAGSHVTFRVRVTHA